MDCSLQLYIIRKVIRRLYALKGSLQLAGLVTVSDSFVNRPICIFRTNMGK